MWVKKYVEKRLLKMFLTEDVVWWGKDTNQRTSARSLTLFSGGVGIVWSTTAQPEHESVMPLLSLSLLNVTH